MTIDLKGAKSVKAETANTEVTENLKHFQNRNAYQVKPEMEYNPGTSVPQPMWLKMYAELMGIRTIRS